MDLQLITSNWNSGLVKKDKNKRGYALKDGPVPQEIVKPDNELLFVTGYVAFLNIRSKIIHPS